MVRPCPLNITTTHARFSYVPVSISIFFFFSVFTLIAFCAKRGTKSTKGYYTNYPCEVTSNNTPPRSPLSTPKKSLSGVTNPNGKKGNKGDENDLHKEGCKEVFGEGGLWQKNILMGEKCQPLEFSGVIYYDNDGKQVSEMPRSPRISVGELHTTFSFPMSAHHRSSLQ